MLQIEENKYLSAILNSVIDAVIIIDSQGRIISFNPAAEQIFGHSTSDVLGKNVKMLMPEPYQSNHDQFIKNYLETGKRKIIGYGREAVGRRKNGDKFPVDIAISEVKEKEVHCFVGVVRDMTEKKESERQIQLTLEKLAKSRRDFLTVLNQLNQAIVMFNTDEEVIFINNTASFLFNLSEEDNTGKNWREILPYDGLNIKKIEELLDIEIGAEKRLVTQKYSNGEIINHEFELQSAPNNPSLKFFLITDLTTVHQLRQIIDEKYTFDNLVGKSEPMMQLYEKIKNLSQVGITVLIQGETGTGKELVARALHNLSDRKEKKFIPVNCAGLTDTLISSQLFGHKKGAFTGADHDQAGLFEAANHGTIFLDEIGDISLNLQTSLLRVLQQREYTRLGETTPRKIDVRVIAATNKDLEEEVRQGTFRQDLLYRIKVAAISLPPLRARREDIPLLINKFLYDCNRLLGKDINGISGEATSRLIDYSWPGNVRELQNAVEVAMVSCQGSTLQLSDFPEVIHSPRQSVSYVSSRAEKEKLIEILNECRGNKVAAAKILGIGRSTLYRRLREYDLI